jgi:hypothetical protein
MIRKSSAAAPASGKPVQNLQVQKLQVQELFLQVQNWAKLRRRHYTTKLMESQPLIFNVVKNSLRRTWPRRLYLKTLGKSSLFFRACQRKVFCSF